MSADDVIQRFECDHWPISVRLGGSNHPSNLTWRTVEEHREKTNKHDAKVHAKIRRAEKKKAREYTAKVDAAQARKVAEQEARTMTTEQYAELVYEKRKAKRKSKMPGAPKGTKYDWKLRRYVKAP